MRRASRWAAVLLAIGGLAVGGCNRSAVGTAAPAGEKPAKVEVVAGSATKRVVLTEQAVTRLGIETATVGGPTVPYSALLYDVNGDTWVFEVTGPRTYQRTKVDVKLVDRDTVVLTRGPAPGRTVVTVGAAALYGTELGTGA
jgi:hypothetical protein